MTRRLFVCPGQFEGPLRAHPWVWIGKVRRLGLMPSTVLLMAAHSAGLRAAATGGLRTANLANAINLAAADFIELTGEFGAD